MIRFKGFARLILKRLTLAAAAALVCAHAGAQTQVDLPRQSKNAPAGQGPCTSTALSIQYDAAGSFGCLPDFTFSAPHTIVAGVSGIFDMHLMAAGALKLPGALSTGILKVTTSTGAISSVVAPAGAIVGTTDSQILTNKTVDGVSPATMGFVDATSSIQTQLNGKQATLTLPLSVANGGTGTASPSLIPGTNVTITGSWPNQTISSSGGGGGGGASTTSQLTDFRAVRNSSTNLLIGSSCSTATPCNARIGGIAYSFTTPGSANISSGTGTLYVYISSSGTLTVGNNIGATCVSTCTAANGVSAFPPDGIPLFTWTVTNGTLDPNGGTDFRSFLSASSVLAGVGLISTLSGGIPTLSIDTTAVMLQAAVPATSTTACSQGQWATDGTNFYLCVSASTWRRTALSAW